MQAAFQLHADNAVSKTINLVESATVEDVAKAYMLGFKAGLKGLTVYRNNSRWSQPMEVDKVKKREEQEAEMKAQQENTQSVTPKAQSVAMPAHKEKQKAFENLWERADGKGMKMKNDE